MLFLHPFLCIISSIFMMVIVDTQKCPPCKDREKWLSTSGKLRYWSLTGTTDLQPVLPVQDRYYRSGLRLLGPRWKLPELCGTGLRPVLPIQELVLPVRVETSLSSPKTPKVVRYRSETGTTDPRPVLPVRDRYYRSEIGTTGPRSVLPVDAIPVPNLIFGSQTGWTPNRFWAIFWHGKLGE